MVPNATVAVALTAATDCRFILAELFKADSGDAGAEKDDPCEEVAAPRLRKARSGLFSGLRRGDGRSVVCCGLGLLGTSR